jgi:PadR family transcriptional regulator, regulatory protein PadR
MPRRRWGSGWGAGPPGGACPRRISRFLEPCLLLLLRVDASHGYNLMEGLQQFGFVQGTVDASVVYRVLREMEQGGWVSSEWDTAGSGPPRRVYQVTRDGEEYLGWWIADLRRTRDEIDQFIETYARQKPAPEQPQPAAGHTEA